MSAILDIALSGLRSAQIAIDLTAHNVANASVEGYSRQRAVVATQSSEVTSSGFLGGGVVTRNAERITNRWTEQHLNNQLNEDGYYNELYDRLSQVESVFNETSTAGIGSALNDFYDAVANVADNPESTGDRVALGAAGQQLAARLQNSDSQLAQMLSDSTLGLNEMTGHVNELADELARINGLIAGKIRAGGNASDQQDRRDMVIRELSELTGGSGYVTEDGADSSFSVNGIALVIGNSSMHLDPNTSGFTVRESGQAVTVSAGKLGALSEMVSTGGIIDTYRAQLNTLASSLISGINAVHYNGYGLDGVNHRDFFTGTGASNIAVSQDMVDNPGHIAASGTGAVGNQDNARLLLATRSAGSIAGTTWDDYYQSIVGGIGGEVSATKGQRDSLDAIVTNLKNASDETRGVSLDEEMAHLIQFQQVFNASTRLVKIVDDLTQAVLNIGN